MLQTFTRILYIVNVIDIREFYKVQTLTCEQKEGETIVILRNAWLNPLDVNVIWKMRLYILYYHIYMFFTFVPYLYAVRRCTRTLPK